VAAVTREFTAAPGVHPATFRHALGHFLTGVTIVTTAGPAGEPVGMTANAFTSVSLDPPLVMICLARSAASFAAMERADRFAVHILHGGQHELSSRFARSASAGEDKFADVAWHRSEHSVPLLDDSLARVQCTKVQRIELGDHVGYVGRVDAAEAESPSAVSPLGFFRGRYASLSG
jgi:flavin reductase (DIM6/NTAB) family NADH-FMN oxidoreductase RutF